MEFWKVLLIFGFGCFVGCLLGMIIISLCQVAAAADRRIEKQILERYEREKAEAKNSS